MKQLVNRVFLGIAGLLTLAALPAYSSSTASLNFGSVGAATYTATGGSFYISSVVGNTTFTVPNTANGCAECLLVTYSTSAAAGGALLTITNGNGLAGDTASAFSGVTIGGIIYSASASTGLSITGMSTVTDNTGTLNLTVTDLTPLALDSLDSNAFFNDLISSNVLSANTPDSFILNGGIIGGDTMNNNLISSESLAMTGVTPEPSSIYLFGAGLVAIAVIARKRRPDLFESPNPSQN